MNGDDHPGPETPPPACGLLDVEVVRDEAGEAVVFVRGALDRHSVSLLAGSLRAVLDTEGPGRTVVVNLAETRIVDVGGMSTLFEAAGWALAQGSRLYLAGCSAQLLPLLHVADLYAG